MRDASCPPEIRQLGRTLRGWRTQIAAWHEAQVSNGPTETMMIWSPDLGVVDVADEAVNLRQLRVIWSL
jgi:hypothetical protein